MQRTKPPFRADMVGSLLRPEPLKEARAKRAAGEITAEELRAVEDREIEKILAQAGGGRAAVGDRRRVPPRLVAFRFPRRARRLRAGRSSITASPFHGVQTKAETVNVVGKVGWPAHHPMIEHFKFLKEHTAARPEDDHPEPERSALPLRLQRHQVGLSGHRRLLRRRRHRLWQGDPRLLRRRLPLPAARRHGLGLSLLGRAARAGQGARRRRRPPAGALRPHDQQGARSRSPPT